MEGQGRTGDVGGAPPPLGRRGTPKEQARAIMAQIIHQTLGGGPHSGQTPALSQQAQPTRGARGRGRRGKRGSRGDGERRDGVEGKERSAHDPPHRSISWRKEGHLEREGREEVKQEPKGAEEGEEGDEETPWGALVV